MEITMSHQNQSNQAKLSNSYWRHENAHQSWDTNLQQDKTAHIFSSLSSLIKVIQEMVAQSSTKMTYWTPAMRTKQTHVTINYIFSNSSERASSTQSAVMQVRCGLADLQMFAGANSAAVKMQPKFIETSFLACLLKHRGLLCLFAWTNFNKLCTHTIRTIITD